MKTNISMTFGNSDDNPEQTISMIKDFSQAVADTRDFPDEIEWNMLSGQSFITSIQTTTGFL
jgi:hypothetical protein